MSQKCVSRCRGRTFPEESQRKGHIWNGHPLPKYPSPNTHFKSTPLPKPGASPSWSAASETQNGDCRHGCVAAEAFTWAVGATGGSDGQARGSQLALGGWAVLGGRGEAGRGALVAGRDPSRAVRPWYGRVRAVFLTPGTPQLPVSEAGHTRPVHSPEALLWQGQYQGQRCATGCWSPTLQKHAGGRQGRVFWEEGVRHRPSFSLKNARLREQSLRRTRVSKRAHKGLIDRVCRRKGQRTAPWTAAQWPPVSCRAGAPPSSTEGRRPCRRQWEGHVLSKVTVCPGARRTRGRPLGPGTHTCAHDLLPHTAALTVTTCTARFH